MKMIEQLEKENTALQEQNERLVRALEATAVRAFNIGTLHGHEDTVESRYTIIMPQDLNSVNKDIVEEMLCDGSMPEAKQALAQSTGTPLTDRVKELEKWKEFPNKLRERLKHDSKGDVETWGFVAMFMSMIDDVEKALNPPTPTKQPAE